MPGAAGIIARCGEESLLFRGKITSGLITCEEWKMNVAKKGVRG